MKIINCTKNCLSSSIRLTGQFVRWNGRMIAYTLDTIAFIYFRPIERIGNLVIKVLKCLYGIQDKPKKKRRRSYCVIHADTISIKGEKIDIRKSSTPAATPAATLTQDEALKYSKPAPLELPITPEGPTQQPTVLLNVPNAPTPKEGVSSSSDLSGLSESDIISVEKVTPLHKDPSTPSLPQALKNKQDKLGPPPYAQENKEQPKKHDDKSKGILSGWFK